MTEKNLDASGRFRSKTVAFRMSPEEAGLLQRLADISGMTKQDYLISRVLGREVTVMPNKRMQRYMEESMFYVYKELRRIERAGDMPGVHIARAFDMQQTRYVVALFVSAADFQGVAAICHA